MPLMSGLSTFSWKLNVLAARTVSGMSAQPQVGVADGVPLAVLVLPGLGLAAVDPLHPCTGAAEVSAAVEEVDRRIDRAGGERAVLGRGDEVLPGQVGARVLQQLPQRLREAP